ncbi:hypothetical protein [Parapusillimonas granuli]|uniref:Uncharacterized protein n=1 Tax=Parapusillimonas granuli TaxID=380911 RepID=A0A853FX05_9BURK|nr:hypothetical protein [Parapusillimonas granuli]MBB5216482.1 hypothetical protein [Parapusillimonas granuli]MEB2399775.1 hypothetical protein [Alcaligenaceae bacterium]NYT48212.1 hypothetical protein [Parapusillimonas granuli]
MKSDSQVQQPTGQDRALLRNTLLKLTAVQKIVCAAVIAVTALIWYDLLKRLVAFGRGIDYGGLHALGGQAIALLKQYNPFFWWAVVALCTLIIAYFLYGFVQAMQRRSRARVVSEETIALLAARLSEPAREVLRWAWHDRREPVTVGDLQRAYTELRSGRHDRITLARRHQALLAPASEALPGRAGMP